jgi:hypothetical protein
MVVRRSVPALVLALAVLLPACGEDPRPPRAEPKVRLEVTVPRDGATVRAETVAVEGTVEPAGAQVQVLGREVGVEAGRWHAEVPLEPGANLVDVAASAKGRRPDFASLRIVLEVRVTVPDLVGADADSAKDQLEGLGLDVATEDGGGFFDPILPGDPAVCSTEPAAGAQVLPGSGVTLVVARDC